MLHNDDLLNAVNEIGHVVVLKTLEPYLRKQCAKINEPSETSVNILNVINGLSQNRSGGFYTYAGEILPY